jgi:hypothetical protein
MTKNITSTSKSSEVLNCGLLTTPNFIRSLVYFRPHVDSVANMAGSVDSFTSKMFSQIF